MINVSNDRKISDIFHAAPAGAGLGRPCQQINGNQAAAEYIRFAGSGRRHRRPGRRQSTLHGRRVQAELAYEMSVHLDHRYAQPVFTLPVFARIDVSHFDCSPVPDDRQQSIDKILT
jgi:hypothetical protein